MRLGCLAHNVRVNDHDAEDRPQRAVVNGIVALVAVALAVGLVLGGVALVVSRVLGLSGGDDAAGGGGSGSESLYLPKPQRTTASDGPLITLSTDDAEAGEEDQSDEPSASESTSATPKNRIVLQASQTEVASGEQIDLTGIYPGGEGQVLQVQRFENGAWTDFPATIGVSGETFSTYVFTGVAGENRFRVIDNATGKASNEVKVKVG